jgi:decaprenylphospho-beta-D-ribofuranose 2-oxidase
MLCRGLGRSYGDASLPPPGQSEVIGTSLADRVLHFNPETGLLRAESGLSLGEFKRIFMPSGWFTPVSPGTQLVTLGGMVASDVHGKNHHIEGCFGNHIKALKIAVADGRIIECSHERDSDLFFATIGGMGLTGAILEVEVQLSRIPSPWIYSESERIADIDHMVRRLAECKQEWPFTVGWIDTLKKGKGLGRGILMRGRWATADEAPAGFPRTQGKILIPWVAPNWLMNDFSLKAFNALYRGKHFQQERRGIVHPDSFFYPLDRLKNWNRFYGSRGFLQHQCVLPDSNPGGAARRFLELMIKLKAPAYLSVIKDTGEQGDGLLSFPMPGISLAIDFPNNPGFQATFDKLNEFVIAEKGRIYLAKDALTRADHFKAMESRLDRFLAVRNKWDPTHRFASALSARLFGDGLDRLDRASAS